MDPEIKKYSIVNNNAFSFEICTQEKTLTLRLIVASQKNRAEVYQRMIYAITGIQGLEEAYEGLEDFIEYIKDPNNTQINLQKKTIIVVEKSKLKNKKKTQIASIPLSLVINTKKDDENQLINKILLRCQEKKDLSADQIKDILQNIAIWMSEYAIGKKSESQKNQIIKEQIETINKEIKIQRIQFDQKLTQYHHSLDKETQKSLQIIKKQLENNWQIYLRNNFNYQQKLHSIDQKFIELNINKLQIEDIIKQIQKKNQRLQHSNQCITKKIQDDITQIREQMIKKINSAQIQINNKISNILNSLKMFQNFNAQQKIPQIVKSLKYQEQVDSFIQDFENQRKISIKLTSQLNQIPQQIGHIVGLESIQISSNVQAQQFYTIKTLPKSFKKLLTLKTINFDDMDIDLQQQQINKMCHIKTLAIRCTLKQQIPDISHLEQLQQFTFELGQLKLFPYILFQLPNLKSLNLSINKIIKIPAEITKLKNLKFLNISKNPILQQTIQEFIQNLKQLKKLQQLNLSSLQLNKIPNGVVELSLKKLWLSKNLFIKFPDFTGNLLGLQELELDECNNMLQLPNSIGKLSKLKSLSLSSEVLGILPEQIGDLQDLQQFYILQKGSLLQIPKKIQRLKKLDRIVINNQLLRQIPEEICNLTSITYFDFDDNELTHLPQNIGKLNNIKTLYLRRNKLVKVPKSFSSLPKKAKIQAEGNPFDGETIEFLKSMQESGYDGLCF